MRYVPDKETNKLVAALVRDGWLFTTGKHPRVTAPDGRFITFSLSPSDVNAHRQFARDVRRLQTNGASTC